ncbi:histone deacetylase family protein [Alkalisalibacterium limincola]|uniref:Histone deacetylase family protein n=1 Tax=Alkalisalibacterium limincola TaxID=2699169 RepID=A0A5C8KMY2_9GAMM|nr:histone deacetylase family protein [Alkalisalibacterium limincola]TXK60595.1 histone deacetylase family protein [Alkalisalibacterium limincola]
MVIFSHPACMEHRPGPGHPESPERLQAVAQALLAALPEVPWREAPQALRSQLARVHSDTLLAAVLDVEVGEEPYRLDPDTVMSRHSREAALRCAGAGVAAVDAVLRGETSRAFCAVRPPGHHATADIAMGFCLFNAVAVAALHAVEAHGLDRVAIADFDVHHGNGTQAIVEHDERIMYVSSHQAALYPGTGGREERGVGNVLNQPIQPGGDGEALRAAWREQLLPAIDAFRPQLLLVSAGFDAHRLDPLADLNVEAEDYAWLTGELVALARRHARGRVVSLLEGGYSLAALRECSVAHVRALDVS